MSWLVEWAAGLTVVIWLSVGLFIAPDLRAIRKHMEATPVCVMANH